MKKRQYYLLSSISKAQQLVDELLLARINESHMHVVAKEKAPLGNLPSASPLQTSNLIHSIESGLVVGGITGLFSGIAITMALPVDGILGAVTLACMLAGSIIGSWASSMVGSSTPNPNLKKYQSAINEGQILLIVDVPANRAGEISSIANKGRDRHHDWGIENKEADMELNLIT